MEKRGLVENLGRAVIRNSVGVLRLLYYAAWLADPWRRRRR